MIKHAKFGAEFRRAFIGAAAISFVLTCGAAMAQTALTPATPDPQAVGLVDRVEALEGDLRKATAENERLQYELTKSQAEVARLQKIIDDAAPPTPAPSGGTLGQLSRGEADAAVKPAPIDAGDAYKQAYALIVQGSYADAEQAFRDFLKSYPSSPQKPDAHYWLGAALLAQSKGADAAEQFLGIVKSTPKANKAPDAYLSLGSAFKQMGQVEQACGVFRDVPVKFPAASAAVKTKAAARPARIALDHSCGACIATSSFTALNASPKFRIAALRSIVR